MAPITHLLASWLVAAHGTDNTRDCRLVALAGLVPDADGIGLVADLFTANSEHPTELYARYHHYLLHGAFAAAVIAIGFAAFARRKVRVGLLCLVVFHLHLLCDLVGSRGPMPEDLWPIFYFGPFAKDPMWIWKQQWPLDAWPNRIISVVLFIWCLVFAVRQGHSVVGVFHQRADLAFVKILRGWADRAGWRFTRSGD